MKITLLPASGYFTSARQLLADVIFPEGANQRDSARREALTDPLTKLANYRAFELALPSAEADAQTSVVLLDVNNFGLVNKIVSHSEGNVMLVQIADVIRAGALRFGMQARCFRYGGDEFAVLCDHQDAELLRDTIEAMYAPCRLPDGTVVSLAGTIGTTFKTADSQLQARKKEIKENLVLYAE